MSEPRGQTLKCLSCAAVCWAEGAVPDACPGCAAPWGQPGVAIVEAARGEGVLPDGSSVVKDPDGSSVVKDPSTP